MHFTNKVVLITGAASGIGASCAVLFSEEGATVVAVDKDPTGLRRTAESCKNTTLQIVADVSKDDDVQRVIDEAIEKFGKLDVLINSAGFIRFGNILDGNLVKAYDNLIDVNLRAVMQMTSVAAPHLIKTKGNVVNIASIFATKKPMVNFLPYCISKAGVVRFTQGASLELAPHGVRVNCVSPGVARTNFPSNGGLNIDPESWNSFALLNRILEPQEVADLICYLASDRAKGITGSDMIIDNGST